MDALHDDVITHIISFVPGAHIPRFKGLNKTFNRTIAKNYKRLQHEKISIGMASDISRDSRNTAPKIRINVNYSIQCKITFLSRTRVLMDPFEKEEDKVFFEPFLKGHHDSDRLTALLEFLLGKGDVTCLNLMRLPQSMLPFLTKAIKNTKSSVMKTILAGIPYCPRVRDFLQALGNHKQQKKPTLVYLQLPTERLDLPDDVCSLFNDVQVKTSATEIAEHFMENAIFQLSKLKRKYGFD